MDHSSKIGFSFGTTSGIITTLGLIVGLIASNASKEIVISGVLIIAIADAFSDSLGIHISEESEQIHSNKQIWVASLSTYFSKLMIALTFLVPVAFLPNFLTLIISIAWAMVLLIILSYLISPKEKRVKSIIEHVLIASIVIIAGFLIGQFIQSKF